MVVCVLKNYPTPPPPNLNQFAAMMLPEYAGVHAYHVEWDRPAPTPYHLWADTYITQRELDLLLTCGACYLLYGEDTPAWRWCVF